VSASGDTAAMSEENVEIYHRGIDAFNRRDLGVFLELAAPDIEFVPYQLAVEGGDAYRGHSGVREWWENVAATIPNLRVDVEEIRDLGAVLFVKGRLRGTGAGSGAPFERELWQAVDFRDGRLVWWAAYMSEEEALAAAEEREAAHREGD
jgi:ketosteroid isomerase-like protein